MDIATKSINADGAAVRHLAAHPKNDNIDDPVCPWSVGLSMYVVRLIISPLGWKPKFVIYGVGGLTYILSVAERRNAALVAFAARTASFFAMMEAG